MMEYKILFLMYSVFFYCGFSTNHTRKSYYFIKNGKNEFVAFNRVQFQNHTPQNYVHVNRDVAFINNNNNKSIKKLFLDDEWNYSVDDDDDKFSNRSSSEEVYPQFLKHFYEKRLKEPQVINTVRILFNENKNESNNNQIIKFNMKSLKENETISDADMYFYWNLDHNSSLYKTSVVLKLYQLDEQFGNNLNNSNLVENPDIHKLFNVIYISKAQKGWQIFKIKKPFDNWINGEANNGVIVSLSTYDDNKLISLIKDTNTGVFRTFAILNIADKSGYKNTSNNNATLKTTIENSTILCTKRSWYLDWNHFNWNNFILYPENGYFAYQCAGKCPQQNLTNNHAKLKSLNGQKDRICCVPTEYLPLPIMFLDKFGNVALKIYHDIIANKCKCV